MRKTLWDALVVWGAHQHVIQHVKGIAQKLAMANAIVHAQVAALALHAGTKILLILRVLDSYRRAEVNPRS